MSSIAIEFSQVSKRLGATAALQDVCITIRNGILGVQTGAGASTLGFASNIICSSNLPDKVASAIDTQMDDGAMQTGMVRSSGPQVAPNPALAALPGGATTYVENGTDQYTICKQL